METQIKLSTKFACRQKKRTSSCMKDTCTLCPKMKGNIANCKLQSSNSELESVRENHSSSDEDSNPTVKYYKWVTINSMVQKVAVEIFKTRTRLLVKSLTA